jgi:plasmid stability protein
MASFTIRDLDEETNHRLQLRAAGMHRSVEEEVRQILCQAVGTDVGGGADLASAIMERFQPLGGVELVVRSREAVGDADTGPRWRR